jgi:hypothetical protein
VVCSLRLSDTPEMAVMYLCLSNLLQGQEVHAGAVRESAEGAEKVVLATARKFQASFWLPPLFQTEVFRSISEPSAHQTGVLQGYHARIPI